VLRLQGAQLFLELRFKLSDVLGVKQHSKLGFPVGSQGDRRRGKHIGGDAQTVQRVLHNERTGPLACLVFQAEGPVKGPLSTGGIGIRDDCEAS
jgi:hypothetical protein